MRSKTSYRPDIDGLRAIAILAVVLFHAGLSFIPGGYVGVDIFFVISGYLITSHIYTEVLANRFSFATFYTRRAKRILPALLVVLAACLLAGWFLLSAEELKRFATSMLATVGGASNILFWLKTNYFAPASNQLPLLMTWSLGIEEQFYLVFPLFLILLVRWRKNWLLPATLALCVGSFLIAVIGVRLSPATAFYLLPTRAWELGAGALFAITEANRSRFLSPNRYVAEAASLTGLAAILASALLYTASTPFPGEAALLPVLGSVLLIYSRESLLNRHLLSFRPLVFIGLVSYSWYLWHWPMLSFAAVVTDRPFTPTTGLLIVGLAFILAIITYAVIEQPFRRSKLAPRILLPRYAVAAGSAMAMAAVVVGLHGLPSRFSAAAAQAQHAAQLPPETACLAQYGETTPKLSATCTAPATQPGIALLGDSHAAALGEGLRGVAQARGQGFTQLTKSSCPPLLGVTRYMPNHPLHAAECLAFNAAAQNYVLSHPSLQTVYLVGYWGAPLDEATTGSRFMQVGQNGASLPPSANISNFQVGLEALVQKLTAAGKKVVVFQDVPSLGIDPIRRTLMQTIPLRHKLASVLVDDAGSDAVSIPVANLLPTSTSLTQIINGLAKYPGTTVVNPADALCTAGRCAFAQTTTTGTTVLYRDFQHLSEAGARFVLGNSAPGNQTH